MPSENHTLNVFVFDRQKRPITGAVVYLLLDGEYVGDSSTRGPGDAPVQFEVPDVVKTVQIEVELNGKKTQRRTVTINDRNCTFTIDTAADGGGQERVSKPPWK